MTKYIYTETLISCIINGLFSFAFTYGVFHAADVILQQDLIMDAIPQSFAVGFFAAFPATLLTRKRLAKGTVSALEFMRNWLPKNIFLRSLTLALIVTIVGVVGHSAVFTGLNIEQISLTSALIYKTIYGIVITLLITPFALKCAMSEVPA